MSHKQQLKVHFEPSATPSALPTKRVQVGKFVLPCLPADVVHFEPSAIPSTLPTKLVQVGKFVLPCLPADVVHFDNDIKK